MQQSVLNDLHFHVEQEEAKVSTPSSEMWLLPTKVPAVLKQLASKRSQCTYCFPGQVLLLVVRGGEAQPSSAEVPDSYPFTAHHSASTFKLSAPEVPFPLQATLFLTLLPTCNPLRS